MSTRAEMAERYHSKLVASSSAATAAALPTAVVAETDHGEHAVVAATTEGRRAAPWGELGRSRVDGSPPSRRAAASGELAVGAHRHEPSPALYDLAYGECLASLAARVELGGARPGR